MRMHSHIYGHSHTCTYIQKIYKVISLTGISKFYFANILTILYL